MATGVKYTGGNVITRDHEGRKDSLESKTQEGRRIKLPKDGITLIELPETEEKRSKEVAEKLNSLVLQEILIYDKEYDCFRQGMLLDKCFTRGEEIRYCLEGNLSGYNCEDVSELYKVERQ